MNLLQNRLYREDVRRTAALPLPYEKLKNSKLLISGATGLIGSFLVDVIMEKNRAEKLNCTVIGIGRSPEKAKARFSAYEGEEQLVFIPMDIREPFSGADPGRDPSSRYSPARSW